MPFLRMGFISLVFKLTSPVRPVLRSETFYSVAMIDRCRSRLSAASDPKTRCEVRVPNVETEKKSSS